MPWGGVVYTPRGVYRPDTGVGSRSKNGPSKISSTKNPFFNRLKCSAALRAETAPATPPRGTRDAGHADLPAQHADVAQRQSGGVDRPRTSAGSSPAIGAYGSLARRSSGPLITGWAWFDSMTSHHAQICAICRNRSTGRATVQKTVVERREGSSPSSGATVGLHRPPVQQTSGPTINKAADEGVTPRNAKAYRGVAPVGE